MNYYEMRWHTVQNSDMYIDSYDFGDEIRTNGDKGISLINIKRLVLKGNNFNGNKNDILFGGFTYPIISESLKSFIYERFNGDLKYIEFIPVDIIDLESSYY